MKLEALCLTSKEITKLNKKNFYTVEDVQEFYPRKYYDYSVVRTLNPRYDGKHIAILGRFDKWETKKTNGVLMLKAKVYEKGTDIKLNVMWIGNYYMKNIIEDWEGMEVLVCGKMTYNRDYRSFHMLNPDVFSPSIEKHLKVMPVYRKMSGISEEWMGKIIRRAFDIGFDDALPSDVIEKYALMDSQSARYAMHHPKSVKELLMAQNRLIFENLYKFACAIEKRNNETSKGTVYNIKNTDYAKAYIKNLPFLLTDSQKGACNDMLKTASEGRRIQALVQGDVGSGKTAVAAVMMFSFASSGYQSVLMAPTEVLARQHYKEISEYADKMGVKCVFLTSSLKAAEKKGILKQIEDGSAQIIIGTHSVVSEGVLYKDLALSVVDEEHRFGTAIEEALFEKSDKGMHTITMSATPIPRTICDVIFSGNTSVYDLERPAGRQEVQTCIFNNDAKIYEFIEKQINQGRQAYVICPLIDSTENSEKRKIKSIEQTEKEYRAYFEPKGISVMTVTGKTKKDESEEILNGFKNGKVQILIATTIIEVGVNNPNASTIVISNAECFGVAQLHQLRGRVGRGGYKGYCILKSEDRENERLNLVCSTTNGFTLAEEDAKLRGPGDLLGDRQSGSNKDIELVLKYPDKYEIAKKEAKAHLMPTVNIIW